MDGILLEKAMVGGKKGMWSGSHLCLRHCTAIVDIHSKMGMQSPTNRAGAVQPSTYYLLCLLVSGAALSSVTTPHLVSYFVCDSCANLCVDCTLYNTSRSSSIVAGVFISKQPWEQSKNLVIVEESFSLWWLKKRKKKMMASCTAFESKT